MGGETAESAKSKARPAQPTAAVSHPCERELIQPCIAARVPVLTIKQERRVVDQSPGQILRPLQAVLGMSLPGRLELDA